MYLIGEGKQSESRKRGNSSVQDELVNLIQKRIMIINGKWIRKSKDCKNRDRIESKRSKDESIIDGGFKKIKRVYR
jgi:hypothetical protein